MNLNLTKEQQLILLGVSASIIVGLGVTAYRRVFDRPPAIPIEADSRHTSNNSQITVHVCGAVRQAGVYKLRVGDRILAAINLAGGALPSANLSAVNLAESVKDGQKIEIPAKSVSVDQEIGGQNNQEIRQAAKTSEIINLNTADEKTLDSLPGIGPATAKAIVEFRKTKGLFTRLEQLMKIPRFSRSKFEKVKTRIRI